MISDQQVYSIGIYNYVTSGYRIYPYRENWKNPNNLIKYDGGGLSRKIYYFKEINVVKGTNKILITIVKTDDGLEYNKIIHKKFSDQFTFVKYFNLTEKEREENKIYGDDRTSFLDNAFLNHNINKQNAIIDNLIEDMRAILPSISSQNTTMTNIDEKNKLDLMLKGGEGIHHKAEKVIVLNRKKKPKKKLIILEEDPIIGFEGGDDYSFCIDTATGDDFSIAIDNAMNIGNISIGGDTATNHGEIYFHDPSTNQTYPPHNGIRYNNKVRLEEETLLLK